MLSRPSRLVAGALLAVALATLVGIVALWPARHHFRLGAEFRGPGGAIRTVPATVDAVHPGYCGIDDQGQQTTNPPAGQGYSCLLVDVSLRGGTTTRLQVVPGLGTPPIADGNHIRVFPTDAPVGPTYAFADFDRGRPLLLFAVVGALVLIGVARLRGLAAVVGLVAGVVMVVGFLLPAILSGESALPVALTGCAALLFVLLYGVHGISLRTSCALLGTLLGLGLVGVFAYAGVHLGSIYGQDLEQFTSIQAYAGRVDIRDLIIGGFVVGAVGALNDLTVTQASAVWELKAADPTVSPRRIYRSAMRVGRDHVASAAYTLVFAYVGTALPTLLVFSLSGQDVFDVVTSDTVAVELIAALVGVLGLVLVVPVTTALSALVVDRIPTAELRASGHSHAEVSVPGRMDP